MPQTPGTETVTLRLPSGEEVDAVVPAGMSDQDVQGLMRQKHPEYFPQDDPRRGEISATPSAGSRFWTGVKRGTGNAPDNAAPTDPNRNYLRNPDFADDTMLPGSGVYRDIKAGNYAGAAGRIAGPAVELGTMLMGGRGVEPEPPPVYSGARFPEAPPPELIKSTPLAVGGRPTPPEPADALATISVRPQAAALREPTISTRISPAASSGLGRIPAYPEPPSVYPGANLPARPQPELLQARGLGEGTNSANIAPSPSSALGNIPVAKPIATSPQVDTSPAKIGSLLNEGTGGQPLESNVPIGKQLNRVTPTPKESSVISKHSYDPASREMTVLTKNGAGYVHGDVSPEQAQSFANASSKGKAWNDIRNNSTLVAKIVNGKRVPVRPPANLKMATPNDLTPILTKSVEAAQAAKAK